METKGAESSYILLPVAGNAEDVADGEPTSTASAHAAGGPKPHLRAVALGFLVYATVSGGPVGIEDSVGKGGALLTMIGLVVLCSLWAAPQAFVTAELASAMPTTNAGSVDWVLLALGSPTGIANAFSLIFSQLFDLPLYPTLVVAALSNLADLSPLVSAAVKLGLVIITATLNIIGIDAVVSSATVLTALVLLPFAATPVVAAATGKSFDWSALATIPDGFMTSGSLGLFLSGLIWNLQGFTQAGNVAAEVAEPNKTFPKGIGIALTLVVASYGCCVIFGTAIHPNLADWSDGFLVNVGREVAPWLGVACGIAACVAGLSTFIGSMAAYSRSLQGMVQAGIVPLPWLGRNWARRGTPAPAILALSATTTGLMFIDLSSLVAFDTAFANISIVLTVAAFFALRRRRPRMVRPYRVPCGAPMAWAMLISITGLACLAAYATGTSNLYAAVVPIAACVVVGGSVSAGRMCYRRCCSHSGGPEAEADEAGLSLVGASTGGRLRRRCCCSGAPWCEDPDGGALGLDLHEDGLGDGGAAATGKSSKTMFARAAAGASAGAGVAAAAYSGAESDSDTDAVSAPGTVQGLRAVLAETPDGSASARQSAGVRVALSGSSGSAQRALFSAAATQSPAAAGDYRGSVDDAPVPSVTASVALPPRATSSRPGSSRGAQAAAGHASSVGPSGSYTGSSSSYGHVYPSIQRENSVEMVGSAPSSHRMPA